MQSELLQTQSEVQRLLDRVAESSRDRSEMVSSRVHTQLIQIADERAQVAERRNLELEREVRKCLIRHMILRYRRRSVTTFTRLCLML